MSDSNTLDDQIGNIIIGTEGHDTLIGGGADDTIYGFGGYDWISAGAGNDLIYGGAGYDTIYGGAGNDTIFGGVDANTLYGGDGDDLLYSGQAENIIFGGDGYDTVNYQSSSEGLFLRVSQLDGVWYVGEDNVVSGVEAVIGSGYYDHYQFNVTTLAPTMSFYSGAGDDSFYFSAGPASGIVEGNPLPAAPESAIDVTLSGGGGFDNFTIENYLDYHLHIYGGAGDDGIFDAILGEGARVHMGDGNDIVGNTQIESGVVYGGAGDDELIISQSAEAVGHLVVYGGDGDDYISAGVGTGGYVTVIGGEGADNLGAGQHLIDWGEAVFVYTDFAESTEAASDEIHANFRHYGDISIDLSALGITGIGSGETEITLVNEGYHEVSVHHNTADFAFTVYTYDGLDADDFIFA